MIRQPRSLAVLLLFLLSAAASAGVRLPVPYLRDQADTAHCWSYAMSNLLESRALAREGLAVHVNVEKDVVYWINYERMKYITETRNEFYLGSYEGGWQIEY